MTSPSTFLDLPPILLLPSEIKLEIISCLYPTSLIDLRLTHTFFANIISKADARRSSLAWTETRYSYSFPRSHYACYECLKYIPAHSFCDDSKTGGKCSGGKSMEKRFCLDCGVEKGRYLKGAPVSICGRYRAPCQQCGHFFFGREHEMCTFDCPEYVQRKAVRNAKKWENAGTNTI